jgi:hypothetical protein
MIAGDLMMLSISASSSIIKYITCSIFITNAIAIFQTPNNIIVMGSARMDQKGSVSGILALGRNIGLIAGASVMGTIFAMLVSAASKKYNMASSAESLISGYHQTFIVAVVLMVLAAFILTTGSRKKEEALSIQ